MFSEPPPEQINQMYHPRHEELFISLVGSTLTTVVVFLPIVFINKQVKILLFGIGVYHYGVHGGVACGGGHARSSPGVSRFFFPATKAISAREHGPSPGRLGICSPGDPGRGCLLRLFSRSGGMAEQDLSDRSARKDLGPRRRNTFRPS